MYVDKLDGVIHQDEYVRLSNRTRNSLSDIKDTIAKLKREKDSSIVNGTRALELAQKASLQHSRQNTAEKRKLVSMLHSNSTWGAG